MFRRLWKCLGGGSGKPQPERHYFISTPLQSQERLRQLGLAKPSEVATGILDYGIFPGLGGGLGVAAPAGSTEEGRGGSTEEGGGTREEGRMGLEEEEKLGSEYRADPWLEWVIEIAWERDGHFSREELRKVFNKQWSARYAGAEVYGLAFKNKRWTYVLAGEEPERFGKLEIGVSLLRKDDDEDDEEDATGDPEEEGHHSAMVRQHLEAHLREIQRRMLRYGRKIAVRAQEPIETAVQRAEGLRALKAEFQRDVVLVLKSDNFFLGMMAWDALLSVGLQWGDGDLFHWPNPDHENGDDAFFSVWTSSEPGYFFPEGIRDGQHNPEDLVFGYWIGRCAHPLLVFDAMIRAAEFCRERLGGRLLDRYGRPFDREGERTILAGLVQRMEKKGLQPGSERALRVIQ